MSAEVKAFGYGIATVTADGTVLDTFFHSLGLGTLADSQSIDLSRFEGNDQLRRVSRKAVTLEVELSHAPINVSDAYLRLHLLSHRIVKPHGLSLEGIFGLLNNVVWTSHGPCAVIGFAEVLMSVSLITPVPVPAVLVMPVIVFLVHIQLTPSVGLIGL